MPICFGVVQIFQVDLGCTLDQLASFQVLTLRELLVDRLRGLQVDATKVAKIRGAIPPGTPADGKAIGRASARLRQSSSNTAKMTAVSAESAKVAGLNKVPPTAQASVAMASTSLAETATTLSALEGAALNQYITVNKASLWWILCELIPDWAFCWQELGEVSIQSDGSFWAEICFWCPQDFPDLYFEVVQNIDGVDQEISDPQIACSTYYDYDGSQSVDIIVDYPQAMACAPTDGGPDYLYVEVLGITDIPLENIDGLTTPFTLGSGLVTWGGSQPVPFGGTLGLNMKFHPGMLGYYYRWSYMFDGDAKPTEIHSSVTHRYQQLVSISPLTYLKVPVPLGPFPVGVGPTTNLFAFQDLSLDWFDQDNWNDEFYGFFDTTGGITDPVGYDYLDSVN